MWLFALHNQEGPAVPGGPDDSPSCGLSSHWGAIMLGIHKTSNNRTAHIAGQITHAHQAVVIPNHEHFQAASVNTQYSQTYLYRPDRSPKFGGVLLHELGYEGFPSCACHTADH